VAPSPALARQPVISLQAIYVMWARMVRRTLRAPSRLVASVMFPIFLLFFLGSGFRGARFANLPESTGGYLAYLTPGIVAMSLLFSSTFAGLSVLWDRQFGFLREIMVTPVSRLSIVLGRIVGGLTLGLGQSAVIYVGGLFLGAPLPTPLGAAAGLLAAVLLGTAFIGMGLIFSSMLKDPQGFSIIMNFLVFPLFLLSGALYPVDNLPAGIRWLSYLDPLTYGADALRMALLGSPGMGLGLDLAVLGLFASVMVGVGVLFFSRVETG